MNLNRKIQNILNENGVTQNWVVNKMNEINPKINMDKTKMSAIVNGVRKVSGDELLVFCMAMKISPDIFTKKNRGG